MARKGETYKKERETRSRKSSGSKGANTQPYGSYRKAGADWSPQAPNENKVGLAQLGKRLG